jgi:hypothetical protein
VRDVSGVLIALLDRCGAAAVVVRPDRYVYRSVGERELCAPMRPAASDAPAPVAPGAASTVTSAHA